MENKEAKAKLTVYIDNARSHPIDHGCESLTIRSSIRGNCMNPGQLEGY